MEATDAARRVLLVDDDRDFAETVADILTTRGYAVSVALTPAEAEARLAEQAHHVAFVDVRLGLVSGINLIASLRAARPGLVCVVMTAYADVETAVRALEQGAYHYLRKPIDARDLLSTLERCLEKVRLEQEKATAEEALRARNAELAEINARLRQMVAAAQHLAACSRLDELGDRLLHEVVAVMAAEGGSIFFKRGEAFELVSTMDGTHVPGRLPVELPPHTPFGRAVRSLQPVLVRDIAAEGGLRGSGWSGYRDGSFLVFPIKAGDELKAVLSLHNKKWPPFTEQDLELGQVMISLSAEILKSQQAAHELVVGEERYRLLAENALDVIGTTDAALHLRYVSPSVVRLTGYTVGEVLERGLSGIVAAESLAAARRALGIGPGGLSPGASPGPATLDFEIRRKDGGRALAEVTVSALPDPERPGLLGVARDVTSRRAAEAQLARLATAIEQATEAVALTDTAGLVQYVNPAFERTTGYPLGEAVGRKPGRLDDRTNPPAVFDEIWTTVGSGNVWRGRLRTMRKDGTPIVQDGTVSPIRDARGLTIGYVWAMRDVTRQVALEARVAETQKLEAIGRLAGGIAHDFNNILSAIFGFVDLADRVQPQGEKLTRYLGEIRAAAKRASRLTSQILTFSRQGPIERRPVEVKAVVSEAMALMRVTLPSTVEIAQTLSSGATVLADSTQIHQVVMNLCTNAGLAMGAAGGRLEVSVTDQEIDAATAEVCPPLRPGPHVCITVRDTGCGMRPEVQARIFEPFYTTRAKGEGSGMGLAVVHGIVEDHGGAVTVASTPGAGSVFRVLLPVIALQQPDDQTEPMPATGSEHVLFVDDQAAVVRATEESLSALGYRVTGACTTASALERVRAEPDTFDVLVTDSTMPGMTGAALAAEVMRMRPGLPVVLCSGLSDELSLAALKGLGIQECLAKPVSIADLTWAIRRALAAARAARRAR